jgi:DNA-binding LacI/PurR family transcriptional regulator
VPVLGDWTARSGYEAGRALLTGEAPTAVFAANDQLALGLLRAFAEGGLRVPEDVSVVGFDDVDGSAYFHPPLTTVRQDFDALGQRCLALVVGLLEGAAPPDELLEPHLVVRGSTGRPR